MGAPIGALMFSVEVTATNYLVSNLWRGFLCATTCAVTFALIHTFKVATVVLFHPAGSSESMAVFLCRSLTCHSVKRDSSPIVNSIPT